MTESSIHLFYFIFHKALRGAHNHQIKGIAWEVRLSLHYLNFTLTGNIILRLGGLVGFSRLLCGYSTSQPCNIFIGCKPHGRISHTCRKPTTLFQLTSATVAQPVEHLPLNFEAVGSSSAWDRFFSHVCAILARNYPTSVSAERATPIPHSITSYYGGY